MNWVGRDAQFVLATLVDLLAPEGAMLDEAAARAAATETLAELFERCDVNANGLTALDALTAEDLQDVMLISVANSINEQMELDLMRNIERGTLTEARANEVMSELRDFVRGIVAYDFQGINLLTLNWAEEGRKMVDDIYRSVYSIMEEAE